MAEIVVNLVIDKLITLLSEEANRLTGVYKEVADLKDELEYIRAVLEDVEIQAERSNAVKIWVKQVQEIAERIEDVIEEYKFHVAQLQADQQHGFKGFLQKVTNLVKADQQHGFKGFLQKVTNLVKSLKHQYDISSEIQDIRTSLSQIKKRRKVYIPNEQGSSSNTTDVTWHDPRLEAHFIGEAEVVGIDDSRDKVIASLVEGTSQLMTSAVVGMGGIGKTTLAKKAFDNHRVKQHFDCHIWITVSQSYNMRELLKGMIKGYYNAMWGIVPEETNTFDEISLINKLRKCLENKRCIVVFDDLWNPEFWRSIKHVFINDNRGSRIIVTTRNHDVASSCKEFSIVHIHKMQPLPPEMAMELFCKKAFKYSTFEGRCPPELEQLSIDIVARCKGLPLAIVVIGGLLSTKEMIVPDWKSFHDNLSLELENNQHLTSIKKILSFSYQDLPNYLKPCFIYLGMYPEDYSIRCPTLIKQWIAEGFVKEEKGKTMEEVANKYLSDLIRRSLVQASMVEDGKANFLKIHDLIREVILSKATGLNFYQVLEKEDASFHGQSRRLSIMDEFLKANESSQVWDNHVLNSLQRYRYPLSILFIVTKKLRETTDAFGKASRTFLEKGIASGHLLRLQILDLENVGLKCIGLPDNIGELIYLLYLNLRGTSIEIIPPSLCNIPNLQTLDLTHTDIYIFHIPILKLQKLKHLYLAPQTKFVTQISKNSFENLQTLKMKLQENVVDDSSLIDGLDKLINLRELRLKLGLNGSHSKKVTDHVVKLKHLHSLKLTSGSGTGTEMSPRHVGYLLLKPLSGLKNLSHLYLDGVIRNPSSIIKGLPQTLTYLKLKMSDFSGDPMPMLEKLHNLRWLFLSSRSYTGRHIVCSKGGFPQLIYLKFGELEELQEWNIEEQAMPRLVELELKQCWSLEVITGLKNLKTLCQLKFTNMPPAFIAKIEKTKEPNCEIINIQGPVTMEFSC